MYDFLFFFVRHKVVKVNGEAVYAFWKYTKEIQIKKINVSFSCNLSL